MTIPSGKFLPSKSGFLRLKARSTGVVSIADSRTRTAHIGKKEKNGKSKHEAPSKLNPLAPGDFTALQFLFDATFNHCFRL